MWDLLAQEAEDADEAELSVELAESCADLGPLCDHLLNWTGNELVSTIA